MVKGRSGKKGSPLLTLFTVPFLLSLPSLQYLNSNAKGVRGRGQQGKPLWGKKGQRKYPFGVRVRRGEGVWKAVYPVLSPSYFNLYPFALFTPKG